MKKVLTTATGIVFALGLTVAAQAAAEKAKTVPAPQVTSSSQLTDKEAAKPQAQKVAAAETKKPEATGKTAEVDKGKKEATGAAQKVQEPEKAAKSATPEQKPMPTVPKTDKK